MRNIKTFEGFFDFFKKKNYDPISIGHLLDCLLPLTDNDKIKSELSGDRLRGIFPSDSYVFKNTSSYDIDHEKFINDTLRDAGLINHRIDIRGNVISFKMQYSPVTMNGGGFMGDYNWSGISDDEVDSIMKECQDTLEGFDCQMTFFIGRGMDEGTSWDKEFWSIKTMVDRTVKRMDYGKDCVRNITVKIKALGGIEE
jgi:hypothetical protein